MPKARASEDVQCAICGLTFAGRGLASHTKNCSKKAQERLQDEEFVSIMAQQAEKHGKWSNHLSNMLYIY
jgi:hypothetical protein